MSGRQPMEDLVVVIPGILGSVLSRQGDDIWSTNAGGMVRALATLGRSTAALQLGSSDHEYDDGIVPPRVLGDVSLIPGLWRIDGYTYMARSMRRTFDMQRGENYFEFAYDWRRDNRRAAKILAEQSAKHLRAWRRKSGNDNAQLILIAHSMGGLVSRYFLEVLGGWNHTRMLITLGTPYRGAVEPMRCLTNGVHTGLGIFGPNLTGLVRSFPSVYQLMATWPCIDDGNGGMVRPHEYDALPNLDPTMKADAARFHKEITEAVATNRKSPRWEENGYKIHPIVGISQKTLQTARMGEGPYIEVSERIGGKRPGGDGSVSRYSAMPRELDVSMASMYSPTQHAALQNCDSVLKHMEGMLSASAETNALFLGGDRVPLALEVPEITASAEPLKLGVEALGEPEGDLVAIVEDAMTGEEKSRTEVLADPWEPMSVELPPPGEGTWRVRVVGQVEDDVEPNAGVWVSMDPETA